jgi:hypothetical protein
MEKRGVVEPGRTKPQDQLAEGEKTASSRPDRIRQLDDDFTKRAADKACSKLTEPQRGS